MISLFDDSVEVEGHDVGRKERGSKPEFTFSHRLLPLLLLLQRLPIAGAALCVVRIVVHGKQRQQLFHFPNKKTGGITVVE